MKGKLKINYGYFRKFMFGKIHVKTINSLKINQK